MAKVTPKLLQTELIRVNEFIRFADKKIGFIFLIYSALFTFWISKTEILLKNINLLNIILFGITSIMLLLGGYFIIRAVFPRLENVTKTNKSLFFFMHIANMKLADFSKKFLNISENDIKKQILEQIYSNSHIASKKMKNVQNSIICLAILILTTMIFILKDYVDLA